MADNLKKKKADAKRFAILQKHERTYMKKQLKKLLKAFELDLKIAKGNGTKPVILLWEKKNLMGTNYPTKPIIRCLKGALKLQEILKNR